MPPSVATSSDQHYCRSRGSEGRHAAGRRLALTTSLRERSSGVLESIANMDLQTLGAACKRFHRSSTTPTVELIRLPLPAAALSGFVSVSPGTFEAQLCPRRRDSSLVLPATRCRPKLFGSVSWTVNRYTAVLRALQPRH